MANSAINKNEKNPSPGFVFISGTNIQLPAGLTGFLSKAAPELVSNNEKNEKDMVELVSANSSETEDTKVTTSLTPKTPPKPVTISGSIFSNIKVPKTKNTQEETIGKCTLDLLKHLEDVSNVMTVTISDVPARAVPSVGTDLGHGNWIVMAGEIKKLGNLIISSPYNSGESIPLKIVAATATAGGDFKENISTIDAVFDVPLHQNPKPALKPALKLNVSLGKGVVRSNTPFDTSKQ